MAYLVKEEGFEDLFEAWDRLLPSCVTRTVFQTPGWQRAWWEEIGSGAELLLLSIREEARLLGVAPLVSDDGVLSFIGDVDLFDYRDFSVVRGRETAFYHSLVDYLERLQWHTIDLRSLPQKSVTSAALADLYRDKGYSVELVADDLAMGTPLPGSWEDYLSGLTKKDRHELRRKMRRLESWGQTRYYACTDAESISEDMGDFFRLLRASRQDKLEFLTPPRERFFLAASRQLARRGQLRLYFLELDGVRVASALCFDHNGCLLLYNSGYDPSYASLSVGLLSKALCIKDAISAGKRFFDFLRGSESYKHHLGGREVPTYRLTVRR